MGRELYRILGISESAPEGEIGKAYRRLARKYHPDINPGDREAEEVFTRISEAYEVLSNPARRRFYDEHGYWAEGVLETREARWDFSFRGAEPAAAGESHVFEEVLDGLFGQALRADGPEAGNDIELRVSLTFRESMQGVATDLEVTPKRRCGACRGSGGTEGSVERLCERCSGSGRQIRARGHLRFSMVCTECRGTGRIREACPTCGGGGRIERKERVRIDIPPGVTSGSSLRVAGRGHADARTGDRGDLFVVTNVPAHPFFRRAGDNLYCRVPVTVSEAALGGKVPVPTIDGEATLRIPPGVQPGQTLRLRGKGAPSLRADGARGDQYVEIQVVVPKVADERSREIFRELARLHPENPRRELEVHAR